MAPYSIVALPGRASQERILTHATSIYWQYSITAKNYHFIEGYFAGREEFATRNQERLTDEGIDRFLKSNVSMAFHDPSYSTGFIVGWCSALVPVEPINVYPSAQDESE